MIIGNLNIFINNVLQCEIKHEFLSIKRFSSGKLGLGVKVEKSWSAQPLQCMIHDDIPRMQIGLFL